MIAQWLTLAEFMAASAWSRRNVFHLQKLGKVQTRKDGRTTLYSSDSLPAQALAKLAPPSTPREELMRPVEPSEVSAPLFAAAESRGPGRRIVLQPEQERQAKRRLAVLQPLLDFSEDPDFRASCQALRLRDGSPVRTADDMALYIVQTHTGNGMKLSATTLRRWKRDFQTRGLEALARKVREDKGRARWAIEFPSAANLVTVTYLQPFATAQRAYDALVRDQRILGMTEIPSYASVCSFLKTLPQAPVVFARQGERAHDAKFASYIRRDYYDIPAHKIMVSDHMIHDVEVRNDCFFGVEENAPMRLRLTAMMDLRSRKCVGYTWTPEGNSRSISTALRQAVKRYGPPEIFYCDNGKDYQKIGNGATPANPGHFRREAGDALEALVADEMTALHESGVLRQLGVKVQYCIKYHPQSKPIERMFRTFHLKLDAIMPHYTTGNAYNRPDPAVAAGAQHRKLLRFGQGHNSPLMPASQFIGMAADWIESGYNASHRHSGRGMDGRTPNEVFDEGYPVGQRRTADPAVLDQLLWRREERLVRNCAVTVNNRRMIGASPYDAEVLYRAGDSKVIVCLDDNDPEFGIITDLSGHKLCDVKAETYISHDAEAGPMIAADLQARRGRRNDTAASIRQLRRDVTAAGHKPAAQHLYEHTLLPMAVGDTITQRVVPAQTAAATRITSAPRYAHEVAADLLREG